MKDSVYFFGSKKAAQIVSRFHVIIISTESVFSKWNV